MQLACNYGQAIGLDIFSSKSQKRLIFVGYFPVKNFSTGNPTKCAVINFKQGEKILSLKEMETVIMPSRGCKSSSIKIHHIGGHITVSFPETNENIENEDDLNYILLSPIGFKRVLRQCLNF